MKTYKYNTLRGFLRACSGQVTAEHVFSGRALLSNGRGWCNVVLSDRARLDAAEIFAAYCVSNKARRADMVQSLAAGRGDLSLFQCFYFTLYFGKMPHVSNSLSGSAFTSVIREYLRRWC